jgi:GNAT superfamily N-acetyltransferase
MAASNSGERTEVTDRAYQESDVVTTSPIGTPPGYRADLERDVTTWSGMSAHVRPIRPDDASRLVVFHSKLTPRSVYRRFFSAHPSLSVKEVERFTCVDYVDRLALIAEIGDRMVAVARYDRTPDTSEAEVAFVVADDCQHHGIASLLLELLADAAWPVGITTFVASTLMENREMINVFTSSKFDVSTRVDCGVVELRFMIDPELCHQAREHKGPPTC